MFDWDFLKDLWLNMRKRGKSAFLNVSFINIKCILTQMCGGLQFSEGKGERGRYLLDQDNKRQDGQDKFISLQYLGSLHQERQNVLLP